MKKRILFLFTCMAVGTVGSAMAAFLKNDFTIINKTGGEIKIDATYGGLGIFCSDDTFRVKDGETKTKHVGGCCLETFKITRTEGERKGSWETHGPDVTGYGISCKSNTFKVIGNPDLSLTVERQ